MRNMYDFNFFQSEGDRALSSAEIIVPLILSRLDVKNVIDFGCGTGQWLNAFKNYKPEIEVLGIDGDYAEKFSKLSSSEFLSADLTKEIALGTKFSLAISLEVAEHLPSNCADVFVKNICSHSDIVLFSAAIPYQGGTHHVNEQYPRYWQEKFFENEYVLCDCIRGGVWNSCAEWFYKQNMFFYVRRDKQEFLLEKFKDIPKPLDCIHPDLWHLRNTKQFFFPFSKIDKNSRVVLYGAGSVGKNFLNQILATRFCDCVLVVDSSYESYGRIECGESNDGTMLCYDVVSPLEINTCDYDFIVIAVEKAEVAAKIKDFLISFLINKEAKIVFENPVWKRVC